MLRILIQSLNKILDSEISLPDIPFPTMGGKVFRDTLADCGGWRLQQNEIAGHCRIIDPDGIRRARGTGNGMFRAPGIPKNSIRP